MWALSSNPRESNSQFWDSVCVCVCSLDTSLIVEKEADGKQIEQEKHISI